MSFPDLASRALGASIAYVNDETYGAADNLLNASPAGHDPTAFGLRGKIYDGWETRRRREVGEDCVIVRLAAPGLISDVTIDTAHFRGNFPPQASLHGTTLLGYPGPEELLAAEWFPLLDHVPLDGDTENSFAVDGSRRLATHVRLTIHPDGGVARLRVHGEVVPDPRALGGRVDLAAALNGGRIDACSNLFYSAPGNVLLPGRATVMSDGWETARRRDDGNDWLVVQLGAPAVLHEIVIDTGRFLGNAPGWARLSDAETGAELLPRTPMQPDVVHRFRTTHRTVTSLVRLDVYPDGGISRLQLLGEVANKARQQLIERWLELAGADVAATIDQSQFFD